MIILAIVMNKGGVGKTSLITNVVAAIHSTAPDKKILLIDCDPQGNAAVSFGLKPKQFEHTMYHVFKGESTIQEVVVELKPNLFLAPSNKEMTRYEFEGDNRFTILKHAIDQLNDAYDYVFIDTPPSLGRITANVLRAVDHALMPFVPEPYSISGLQSVMESIEEFQESSNPTLKPHVVAMMVDSRLSIHSEVLQSARQYCDKKDIHMFDTVIPRSVRIVNAVGFEGVPSVWSREKSTPQVKKYFDLTAEILEECK